MFGDPILNPMNWEENIVINECNCMVPGRDKPKSFTGDIPWVTTEDLVVNGTTYYSQNNLGLTRKEIDEVNRKTIPKGSVIISCVGNLGVCSIAGTEMVINQQLHSFQCGERINNIFLMNYLGYRKDYMNKWASNTTVLYMNKTICNSIPIIIPPMNLQNQFADFVRATDKSKAAVQKALDETQLLFDSLMQEYFG
jgi:type I restriction enzyme S subunit